MVTIWKTNVSKRKSSTILYLWLVVLVYSFICLFIFVYRHLNFRVSFNAKAFLVKNAVVVLFDPQL